MIVNLYSNSVALWLLLNALTKMFTTTITVIAYGQVRIGLEVLTLEGDWRHPQRGCPRRRRREEERVRRRRSKKKKLIIRGSPSISLLPYRSECLKGLPASSHEWGEALSQSHSGLVLHCSAQALSQLRQIGEIRLILLWEAANWFAKPQANWQINSLGSQEEESFWKSYQRNTPKTLRILRLWSAG